MGCGWLSLSLSPDGLLAGLGVEVAFVTDAWEGTS